MKLLRFLLSAFLCCFIVTTLFAARLKNVPQTLIQPNGDKLQCFASGDEYHNWLHDANGYTIIQDQNNGYYVFAKLENGDLVPSPFIAGKVDPASTGIPKGVNISPDKMLKKRLAVQEMSPPMLAAPRTGQLNNIVIFIRFSDEAEFTDQSSIYDYMFNASAQGDVSMYNYFKEVSYNSLSITSTFYPVPPGTTVVSYLDSRPRGFFQPFNQITNPIGYVDDRTVREHTLLMDAANAVGSDVAPELVIDGDNDGNIDNVCFIIDGGPTAWSTLLWPHRWSLYTFDVRINGKRVYDYNFQLQTELAGGGASTLCHEMFHSLGAPDLYHYTDNGVQPAYLWDIMEYNASPPQHMTAYMKMRYGTWISSIPTITTSGTYTLEPLTHPTNNCYKIASPYSASQYFVLEYRKKEGTFESSIPGEGLLVYRINTAVSQGNRNGPPDELFIYRPDGSNTVNGRPWDAAFSRNNGRVLINDWTNPSSILANGTAGGLNVSNIGTVGNTISFTVTLPGTPTWDGDVLVWNPDLTPTSGTNMAALLQMMGKKVDYTTTLSSVPSLTNYQGIFVFLGMTPNNHVLQESEAAPLAAYLNAGGKLFLEGGNAWGNDPSTSLRSYFSIQAPDNGASDLSTVTGISGTLSEGMEFSYAGENSSVDHLVGQGTAYSIFTNLSFGYNIGVAYNQGTYRTIGTSFEFSGLTNGLAPSIKQELVAKILDFFQIPYTPLGSGPPPAVLALDAFHQSVPLIWNEPYPALKRMPITGDDPTESANAISKIQESPKVSAAYKYNVYRSTTSGGPYTKIASNITATSYQNTGLTNGNKYYYVLTTLSDAGESDYSPEVMGYPQYDVGPGSGRSFIFSPSSNPFTYGAAVIGGDIWITEYNESKVYQIDKSTGNVLSSFTSPATPTGIAWDGEFLWIGSATAKNVYKTDLYGVVQQIISVPNGVKPTLITGVAYENGHVWITDRDNYRLLKYNATTGALMGRYTEPVEVQSMSSGPRGLAYDPYNNTLVHVVTNFSLTPTQCWVYEFSLSSETFTGRKFPFNRIYDSSVDKFWSNLRGIAYDPEDQSYWITDVAQAILYRVEPYLRRNELTIRKFEDSDARFSSTDDRTPKSWHLEIHKDSPTGPLIASGDASSITATGLDAGTYYAVEADSVDWLHLGYLIDEVPTESPNNYASVTLTELDTVTIDMVNSPPIYNKSFRTAKAEQWATAYDQKNAKKPVARKADRVSVRFNIIAPNAATSVKIKFGMYFTGAIWDDTDISHLADSIVHIKDKIYTAAIPKDDTLTITGWGASGKKVKVKLEWQTLPTKTRQDVLVYDDNTPRPSKPNLQNVGEELFTTRLFGQGYFWDGHALVVGIPQGMKGANSVKHKKYTEVQKSFYKKTGDLTHTGDPKCLDKFTAGGLIDKQQISLPPDKQSNKLFAELLALKLNIAASVNEKFPSGLGQLTYDDPANPTDPFNGLMLDDMVEKADSVISCLDVRIEGHLLTTAEVYDVVRKIDSTFADAPNFKDTIRFTSGTKLPGVSKLIDIPYLRFTPGIEPVIVKSRGFETASVPLTFALYQNYPNPFNPTTSIQFDLPEQALVTLKVYNMLGQEVMTLLDNEFLSDGLQEYEVDATNLSSGVYLYRIVAQSVTDDEEGLSGQTYVSVKKMVLLK